MNLKKVLSALAAAAAVTLAACSPEIKTQEGVYLGVENYGAPQTDRNHMDSFRYRFYIDGKETVLSINNGLKNSEGEYEYPIQNQLRENYEYEITTENNVVAGVRELPWDKPEYTPPIEGTPGEKTLTNFLKTAMMPVGTTLYIFGGGWNWQDTGPSKQATTIGISPDWIRFFNEQDENYTYKSLDGDEENSDPETSYYPYGGYNEYNYAGLDCSGYVGWVIYNTFQTESGNEGYVGSSTGMARRLGDLGWGTWENKLSDRYMKPGDIMSIDGHVWISLGTCSDGSVVIAHSTPSDSRTGQPGGGAQIGAVGKDENCEAYLLADQYMSRYFPKWYERYGAALKDPEVYFTYESENAGRFSWDTSQGNEGLSDPDKIADMTPDEALKIIFGN